VKTVLNTDDFGTDGTGCGNCMRSFDCGDPDRVACGAAFEDNPIWAQRKYGIGGIAALFSGGEYASDENGYTGTDCESMRPDDGGSRCKAYQRRA
jgi:hypothetical protein